MKVLVIGAGAVGLCSAYSLASIGVEVTVIEERGVGAGASRHNAGWVTPALSAPVASPGVVRDAVGWMFRRDSPLYIRPSLRPAFIRFMCALLRNSTQERYTVGLGHLVHLNLRTFELFDELRAEGVIFEHHTGGLLSLFKDSTHLKAAATDAHRMMELGNAPVEVHDAHWTRAKIPGLSDGIVGAIESPAERYLDPDSFMTGLEQACARMGVQIAVGRRVAAIRASANAVQVRIGDEDWSADQCVVAAGVWTRVLVQTLGVRLALEAGKGYGFDLPRNPGITRALYLADDRVAITPLDSGTRVAGTMAFGGLDERVAVRRARGILTATERCFSPEAWPRTDGTERAWSGLRPMTPDGLPLIGRLPTARRVIVATGHAMLGITLAPVTGRMVRDIVLDPQAGLDGPFAPTRQAAARAAT